MKLHEAPTSHALSGGGSEISFRNSVRLLSGGQAESVREGGGGAQQADDAVCGF